MSTVVEVEETSQTLASCATRRQIRGSGLLFLGYVLELAINFLPHLLLVRYLATADYGAWAYALSLIVAFQTFTLCLNDGMQRFVPIYHEKGEYSKLFGTIIVAFAATLLIGLVFVAGLYLLPGMVPKLVHDREAGRLLMLLIVLVPIEALEVMLLRLFACFHQARMIFFLQHAMAPASRLILVLLLIGYHRDLRFLALGRVALAIPTTILYASMLVRFMRKQGMFKALKQRISLPCREMLVFSSPMILSTALSTFENALIVMLLDHSHGITSVAFYRVVLPLATMNSMVMNAFSWLYVPSASRLLAKGDYAGINHLYWRTAGWISVLTFPIFAVTFCFAGPFTTFLYGSRYAQSGLVLAVLAIASYSNVALGFNGVTLKVLGKIKYVLSSNLTSTTIKVVLCLLLIPRFGALGAAIAVACSLVAYNLLMQSGLRLSGVIRIFDRSYLPCFLLIAVSTACLCWLRLFTGDSIVGAVILSAIASWIVLMAARKQLSIGETFPETKRLPLIGRFLAHPEPKSIGIS